MADSDVSEFHAKRARVKDKGSYDRYWSDPEAARARSRAVYAKNIDRRRVTQNAWYRSHKDSPRVLAARKARYTAKATEFRRLAREYNRSKPWINLIAKARTRAKAKGLDFNLTKDWGAASWTGACAVTGAEFRFERGRRFWSPSIDRIIPELGYVQANCRFVLWAVNSLKGEGSDADMHEVARLIIESVNGRK